MDDDASAAFTTNVVLVVFSVRIIETVDPISSRRWYQALPASHNQTVERPDARFGAGETWKLHFLPHLRETPNMCMKQFVFAPDKLTLLTNSTNTHTRILLFLGLGHWYQLGVQLWLKVCLFVSLFLGAHGGS